LLKPNELGAWKGEILMTENTLNVQANRQPSKPNHDLKSLDRLVGTWKVSGGAQGQVTWEWMEGGFFLIQHVDLEQVKGIEIIGHEQKWQAKPSQDIKSRFYDIGGDTIDYVYELEGVTLMIWNGEKSSPNYFKGEFSNDGNTMTGRWVYPDGGGYEATLTRVKNG
jgi:hypothetical protein